MEKLLTTKQVAERLGVGESTLRYWRHTGRGPRSFTLGARKVAYKEKDLNAWLERQYTGKEA